MCCIDAFQKFECKPGMTCKPMVPPDCLMKFCKPEPVCQRKYFILDGSPVDSLLAS